MTVYTEERKSLKRLKIIYTNVTRGEYGNKRTVFKDIWYPQVSGDGRYQIVPGHFTCKKTDWERGYTSTAAISIWG